MNIIVCVVLYHFEIEIIMLTLSTHANVVMSYNLCEQSSLLNNVMCGIDATILMT